MRCSKINFCLIFGHEILKIIGHNGLLFISLVPIPRFQNKDQTHSMLDFCFFTLPTYFIYYLLLGKSKNSLCEA